MQAPTRRRFLAGSAATLAAAAVPHRIAFGQAAPVKIGILLPYSGTYASLGESITAAFKLRLAEAGTTIAGRPVELIELDSEAAPPKAPQNTKRLVQRDGVDFLVGPVHSGVALAMAQTLRGQDRPLMIIPNAGANQLTRERCAANIFRTSFSNWQTSWPCGKLVADDGHKTLVTITWKYAAGQQHAAAASDHFTNLGGEVMEQIFVPFPDVEFQAHLSQIASLKPDAVFAFFSGGGAVKFVRDYAAAGLKDRIPLYANGFLTDEGVLPAQGEAAEGIKTSMHWAATLDNPANARFKTAYREATGKNADVFAVQGYDTGTLIVRALEAVQGDTDATDEMVQAMERFEFANSPRGVWRLSAARNPIQDFYARRVENGANVILGLAAKALDDPGTGCSSA